MEKKKVFLVLIFFIIIGVIIFFIPDIYNYLNKSSIKKVEGTIKEEKEEKVKITLDSDIVKNLKYPIMRYNVYDSKSYYQNKTFKVSDLNNNEILVNALVDVYKGNITDYNGIGNCNTEKKELKVIYLDSRIRNILSNSIKYEYTDFKVNELYNYTDYVGEWKYNPANKSYIYYGTCNTNNKTKYYDLKNIYKLENEEDTIILYSYMGFSKVENGKYYIYKDENYTDLLFEGEYNDHASLENKFNSLDKNSLKKYKYIFKKGICTYGDYCLVTGEWLSE